MAVLRVRKGGAAGPVHAVFSTRQHTVIGRDGEVEVALGDAKSSRRHAAISLAHGYWVLQDLKSRNGTFVDGKRIERTILRDGTAFQIGATLLTFHEKEVAPPPASEVGGAALIESLREESGVFTFRARQAALDREIRADWLHPSRELPEKSLEKLARAIEEAGRLSSPGFLPLIHASPGGEGEAPLVLLKDATLASVADRIDLVLARPLEERLRAFRELVDLLLERATWESLRYPMGLAHVSVRLGDEAIEVGLPPLDLAAFVTGELGGGPHLPHHADYLPPERQLEPDEGGPPSRGGAPPLTEPMYCLGAMGYHLLTGKKAMGDGDVRSVLENHRTVRPAPAQLLEPGIPASVSALIERMLEKDPRKRPPGRQEVLAEIPILPAAARKAAPEPPPPASTPAEATVEERRPLKAAGAPRERRAPAPIASGDGPEPVRRAAAKAAQKPASHAGLLYVPLWMALWVALFFAARFLTKVVLGQLDG